MCCVFGVMEGGKALVHDGKNLSGLVVSGEVQCLEFSPLFSGGSSVGSTYSIVMLGIIFFWLLI